MSLVFNDFFVEFRKSDIDDYAMFMQNLMRISDILRADDENYMFTTNVVFLDEETDYVIYNDDNGNLVVCSKAESVFQNKTRLTIRDFITDMEEFLSDE